MKLPWKKPRPNKTNLFTITNSKLYMASIDPNNPPAPTDPVWKQVTDPLVLNKLSSANENPITSTDTAGRTAVWNGQNFVAQGSNNPAVKDDFAGKTAGSTVENPNIVKMTANKTSLQAPIDFPNANEITTGSYNKLTSINNDSYSRTEVNNGAYPQILLSFNLIRIWEDKFGLIPVDRTGTASEILARQVEWLKKNLKYIFAVIHGYGVSPLGYKCKLHSFYNSNWWSDTTRENTTNSVRLLGVGWSSQSELNNSIQSDGFVHYLVTTDPASTTSPTLLVLTGHGLSQWDVYENVTRSFIDMVDRVPTTNTIQTYSTTGQIAGDEIRKYHLLNSATAGAGTNETSLVIPNHGLAVGDAIRNITHSSYRRVVSVVDINTVTVATVTGQTTGDSIRTYKYFGTQTAESTVIPSTVYLDYASIELQYKASPQYDVLVPSNPRRDAGLSNILLLEKVYNSQTTDFTGKVAGSTTENANVFKRIDNTSNVLALPSSGLFGEVTQASYDAIKTSNNDSYRALATTDGNIAQHLFSFNIIADAEKYWTANSIPFPYGASADLATKVAWFKANIKLLTARWTGYGQCPSGYKAYLDLYGVYYGNDWSLKHISKETDKMITTNTPATIALHTNYWGWDMAKNSIDANGFVHFLAYTDAAKQLVTETPYDPNTWAEWTKDSGVVGDSTGLEFTTDGVNYKNAKANMTYKPNTKYGILYNVVSNTLTKGLYIRSGVSPDAFTSTTLPRTVGNNKVTFTTNSTLTATLFWIYPDNTEPSGNKIKLKDIRIIELPANSQAEQDFNVMTPDQLNTKYPFGALPVASSTIYTDYVSLQIDFNNSNRATEAFTGNSAELESITLGKAPSFLVELDLTPVANALYGGSNASLKAAFKQAIMDLWSVGSGSSAGTIGYCSRNRLWVPSSNGWSRSATFDGSDYYTSMTSFNNTTNISNNPINTTSASNALTTDNKMYVLTYSQFPSDGNIPSSLSLDFFKVKIIRR